MSKNTRRTDWLPFRCGDQVYDRADSRHIGEVLSVNNGATANIRWLETGWKSLAVPLAHLCREYPFQ